MPQVSARTSADEQVAIICDDTGAIYTATDAMLLGWEPLSETWIPVYVDVYGRLEIDLESYLNADGELPISIAGDEVIQADTYAWEAHIDRRMYTVDWQPTVAAGGSAVCVFEHQPTMTECNFIYSVIASHPAQFEIWDQITYSTSGTLLSGHVTDRPSYYGGCYSAMWIHHTPEDPNVGGQVSGWDKIRYECRKWDGGEIKTNWDDRPFTFAQNRTTGFLMINNGGENATFDFKITWIEDAVT